MNHLEVLTLDDSQRWESLLSAFPDDGIDIYFHPRYYATWKNVYDGEALCLHANIQGEEVLYPFYKRVIDGYELDNTYYDISTAYGYGGAVSTGGLQDEGLKEEFAEMFIRWCKEENVIAEFVREYPDAAFRNTGAMKRTIVRKNLYVDTTPELEAIWHGINNNARRNVRRSVRCGVIVEVDDALETMDGFRQLYRRTAVDRGFGAFYRFPDSYFESVNMHLSGNSFILNAVEGKEVIASVLCLEFGPKVSYHLGASRQERADARANDLLFWEMIRQAKKRGCRLLQLGGGLGLSANDSLYRFKNKYATYELPFFIGTYVHDHAVYDSLCRQWEAGHAHLLESKGGYFLRYREED